VRSHSSFARDATHQLAQPRGSGVRAFALPAGKGIGDEAALEARLEYCMEQVVDDPVAEGGGVDLAVLGPISDEGVSPSLR
jgi:hypothetical protein